MSSRAHVIYCDDTRQEVGGKISYMGVYGPTIDLPSFPQTIQKLCASCIITTPVSNPVQHVSVEVCLVKGDVRTVLAKIPKGDFDLSQIAKELVGVVEEVQGSAVFQIGGIVIEEPGRIETIVSTSEGQLETQVLMIRLAP